MRIIVISFISSAVTLMADEHVDIIKSMGLHGDNSEYIPALTDSIQRIRGVLSRELVFPSGVKYRNTHTIMRFMGNVDD